MRRASVQAALSPSLHPALQAALSSLDVQLEAELTRYRRQRHLQRRRQHDAKPMSMIAVQAVGGRTQPQVPPAPAPEADPWQTEPSAPLAVQGAIAAAQPPIAPQPSAEPAADFGRAIAFNSIPEPITVLQPDDPADESEPDDYLASSEELLRSLAEEEADLRRQRQSKGRDRILTPLGIGSLLLMLLSSATLGYLVLNPGTLQSWNLARFWNRSPAPEATTPIESPVAIEGGEAIEPSVAPSPDLSSQEFHDLNLDTLSTLPMSPSPAPLPTATAIAPSPSVAASPSLPVPASPAQPARPRASVAPSPVAPAVTVPRRTVPTAPPAQRNSTTRSTPAARPAPTRPTVRAAQPTRPAQARPAPRPAQARPAARSVRPAQQAARPAAPRRSPAARPAPRPAAPAASRPATRPSTPPRYVVVSPYSGDRSLEQAQRVVGDAYVRNLPNGAQVQYGAFSDGDRARELSQQLQQQGISAQVIEAGGN
ncbi:hypothetical protein H6F67_09620 [Microcoleus sp. FACHB-1515]|uniref:hypothetical protein n=1 Tax=Cyanophyceae TaxID=3028117 RepID=UPI001681E4B4|nr:hypothetical protein [Microcoleus sp. FACHB-1515]MBD2090110.1 hypothetical protein [Microcoleus sp. FACHB-1515]